MTEVSAGVQMHLDILNGFGSIYIGVLVMGFFYGLTLCSFSCIPLIAPYIFGTQGSFSRGFDATAIFVISRVVAYTMLGALSGLFGSVALDSVDSGWLLTIAGALIVVVGGMVIFKPKAAACNKQAAQPKLVRHPWLHMMTLGFSTSLVPCMPLTAVLFYAATTQSWVTGALLAMMFGLGTSASPLYYIGGAAGWLSEKIRNEIPRYNGLLRILSGVILSIFGVQLLLMGGILD